MPKPFDIAVEIKSFDGKKPYYDVILNYNSIKLDNLTTEQRARLREMLMMAVTAVDIVDGRII